jgi:hypothetical protein
LDAFYDGRYTDAIGKFDAVLVAVPSHAQAHEFQQKAVTLRETEGEPPDKGILLLAGIGAVALVIAIVVAIIIVIVVHGRRRARPGAVPVAYPPASGAPIPCSPAPVQNAMRPAAVLAPTIPAPTIPVSVPSPAPPVSAPPVSAPPISAPTVSPPPFPAPSPSTSLVYCSNCGNGSPAGTKFCPTCGQEFT